LYSVNRKLDLEKEIIEEEEEIPFIPRGCYYLSNILKIFLRHIHHVCFLHI